MLMLSLTTALNLKNKILTEIKMKKLNTFLFLLLMFVLAGSALAQESDVERLLKPADTTKFILSGLPSQVTATIDGQNMTFILQNNADGSITITEPEGSQMTITMSGTENGRIVQQIMPNGDVVDLGYKALNKSPVLLDIR